MHHQSLLRKYLRGNCTREELALLYKQLQHGQLQDHEHLLQQVWDELQQYPALSREDSNRIYQNIEQEAFQDSYDKVGERLLFKYVSVAATILLLLAAGAYWWSQPEWIEVKTAFQETKQVTLPDGTDVTLNASSVIRYAVDLDQQDIREVWIQGEVFFDVKSLNKAESIKKIPFIVNTEVLQIQVLGTQFNVKDRNGKAEVVLKEGKIRLSHQQNTALEKLDMEPGQKVLADSLTGLQLSEVDEPELYFSWQRNALYFDNESLGDIAVELQNHYGIDIQFTDKTIRDLKFTGSVPADQLEVLMVSLEKSFNLNIERDEQQYVIANTTEP